MNDEVLLSIRSVTKKFGGFTAVDNLSFDLSLSLIHI